MNDLSLKLLIDVLTIERHWCNSQQLTKWTTDVFSDFVLINRTTFICYFARCLYIQAFMLAKNKELLSTQPYFH